MEHLKVVNSVPHVNLVLIFHASVAAGPSLVIILIPYAELNISQAGLVYANGT